MDKKLTENNLDLAENQINILVNGEFCTYLLGTTLMDVVADLQLKTKRVAVECNLEIVPKAEYASTLIKDGDKIEVVHAIGGG